MIATEIKIEYLYQACCDHCGAAATTGHPNTIKAREAALLAGYHCSKWEYHGCSRELWLCPGCKAKVIQDYQNTHVVSQLDNAVRGMGVSA